ncbi:MAG: peptidylprolyl isomerase [Desulfobulbaceae bacterium]|uniref:Peptidylprolyl isomerase n=1 Tax=Candidatus Desulfobia pelagia TaxID=2841692 RepID=A0A8J6THE7_9BACT|nr:peptidylprolyl isomerase [Candidatus Desulfobia pelagia]
MYTRILKVLLAVATISIFAAASLHAEDTGITTEKGKIVAKVNGTGISTNDFDRSVAVAKNQFATVGSPGGDQSNVEKEVLDRLIDIELMLQNAGKRGIVIEDVMVANMLKSFKEQFDENNTFNSFLETNSITEEEVKGQMRNQLVLQELQVVLAKEFAEKNTVSDEKVKAFYDSNVDRFNQPEQVRASHILIKVDSDGDEAASQKARDEIEAIQQKVTLGEDFSELARANSSCPSSAQGGDLGFFGKGQMVKPFEDAAFALKPGETSGIVETQFGYHLIKMAEKKDAGIVPFEDVKQRISDYLSQLQLDMAQQEYTKGLRDKAEITTLIKFD